MITIRRAEAGDCRAIAEVQLDSYRNAYAAFFPPGFFEGMTYVEQEADWVEWLATRPLDILLVAVSPDGRVTGYTLGRPGRDVYPGYDAEVLALHVRAERQRHGIGAALLHEVVALLAGQGCRSVMLWTLEGNPVRRWYETLGGQLIGEKRDDVDGWEVCEVAYGWPVSAAMQTALRPARG